MPLSEKHHMILGGPLIKHDTHVDYIRKASHRGHFKDLLLPGEEVNCISSLDTILEANIGVVRSNDLKVEGIAY